MNRKLLGIAVTLLAIAMLASPVMAASPNKLPASISTSGVVTDETNAMRVENPNGIIHVWGAERIANAKLTIGTGASAKEYFGFVSVNLDYIVYPDFTTTMHYHKFKITFPVSLNPTLLTEEGVFEGVNTWSAQMIPTPPYIDLTTFDSHFVLQGSGAFDGNTLFNNRDSDKGVISWILIH